MRTIRGSLQEKSWELLAPNGAMFEGVQFPSDHTIDAVRAEWHGALQSSQPYRSHERRTWVIYQYNWRSLLIDVKITNNGVFRFGGGFRDDSARPRYVLDGDRHHERVAPTDDELRVIQDMRDIYHVATSSFLECIRPSLGYELQGIRAASHIIKYARGAHLPAHKDSLPSHGTIVTSYMPIGSPSRKWVVDGESFEQSEGQVLLLTSDARTPEVKETVVHEVDADSTSQALLFTVYDDGPSSDYYDALRAA